MWHTWYSIILFGKLLCQIGFFVFFLIFFGFPNIERYQQEDVMVVSSTKHSGGIPSPTISIVVRNPGSGHGWKSNDITTSLDVIEDRV